MEDRIHAAGNGDELVKVVEAFEASKRNRKDRQVLYDALVNLGAEDEEADEYVRLCMQ